MSQPGLAPGPLDLEANIQAMRPLHLDNVHIEALIQIYIACENVSELHIFKLHKVKNAQNKH